MTYEKYVQRACGIGLQDPQIFETPFLTVRRKRRFLLYVIGLLICIGGIFLCGVWQKHAMEADKAKLEAAIVLIPSYCRTSDELQSALPEGIEIAAHEYYPREGVAFVELHSQFSSYSAHYQYKGVQLTVGKYGSIPETGKEPWFLLRNGGYLFLALQLVLALMEYPLYMVKRRISINRRWESTSSAIMAEDARKEAYYRHWW